MLDPNSNWLWNTYCSVMSCWKLETDLGGRVYTTISKCYRLGLPTPESPLLSIYQHATACRVGEKFVLIGVRTHWRVLNWGIM